MSDYVPEISPELLAGFIDEAPEYLEILDNGLMALEEKARSGNGLITLDTNEDHNRMNEMFRAAHSFKGLGAAMGLIKIRDLTHVMETLFDHFRMGKLALADDAVETLFKVIDRLKSLINELSNPPDQPVQIDDCVAALEAILRGESAPPAEAPPETASNDMAEIEAAAEAFAMEPIAACEPAVAESAPSNSLESETVPALTPESAVLDNPELTQLFVDSTLETLDEMNAALLKLEESPNNTETINDVFRCAHNIKGASGAAGCMAMNRLTHELETVLDHVRTAELELTLELMQAVFAAADRVRADVLLIKNGDLASLTSEGTTGCFSKWLDHAPSVDGEDETPSEPVVTEIAEEVKPAVCTDAPPDDAFDAVVHVRFPKNFAEAEVQAYLINNKLGEFGEVVATSPDVNSFDGTTTLDEIKYFVRTDADSAEIETAVRAYSVESATLSRRDEQPASSLTVVQPSAAPATPAKTPASAAPVKQPAPKAAPAEQPVGEAPKQDASRAKQNETIRVDLERLDQLMNLGGELVINKARLTQIQGRFDPMFKAQNIGYLVDDMTQRVELLATIAQEPDAAARLSSEIGDSIAGLADGFRVIRGVVDRFQEARGAMNDFSEALHALNRVSEGIQKGIMETRMVSVGPLFQRFRRVVRDISKATGKNVNLVLHGEQTELDKRMIDELGDPLTHMIRNSVDHGIESPEARRAAGKPEVAEVILNAYHRGRHICIEVRDDGKGINIQRVREKIIERELATPTEVERMSEKEIAQYIFKPGLSTAEQVTDLSGRGMGMDIVLTKLEAINGTVDVETVAGQGTVVTIRLPLTLAIITAILARIGEYVYAIPLDMVGEIITVPKSEIQFIQRKRVVRVRERVVPIAFFEQVFNACGGSLQTATRNNDALTLVILEMQNERIGLVVDELIGQEDVVIKSIAENFRNVAGITGASIMGDGRVSLILDVASMFGMFAERSDDAAGAINGTTNGQRSTNEAPQNASPRPATPSVRKSERNVTRQMELANVG